MLFFFDTEALKSLIERYNFPGAEYAELSDASVLFEHADQLGKIWEEYLGPAKNNLDKDTRDSFVSREEREDLYLLMDVESILETLLEAISFARDTGREEQLKEMFTRLSQFGEVGRCRVFKDFAPYSFSFIVEAYDEEKNTWKMYFNGGLIYHGSHDRGGDGGSPTFSVNLSPVDGWTIHT